MSTNITLRASLPNAVLAHCRDVFYTEDIFEAIAETEPTLAGLTKEALPAIEQYLNELVVSGVLWQSGEGYFFRIQPPVEAKSFSRPMAASDALAHA